MSLKNKWIFILGATRFDDPFSSTSFSVAKSLAKDNHVFYVDYPYTWIDCFRLRNTAAFKNRAKHFFSPTDYIKSTPIDKLKIIICAPLASINFLPEGKLYRWLLKHNELKIVQRIKKTIVKFGIDEFIFINSFNFHYPDIANFMQPRLQVYYCVDPIIMPYDKRHGVISENKLVAGSDVVICTSQQLFEEKVKQNINTFFIPNAADIELSSMALKESLPVHECIVHLKKPVIGYLGTIERRMDYTLLKKVIEDNPGMQFVFVGPVSAEFVPAWFFNTPNLILTGSVPYHQTASVIKGFDVALIPFKKDNVSRTIFPLKLFEYLGAGKPVVATDFNPDLQEHTCNTVAYCGNAFQFTEAIKRSLTIDATAIQKRIAVAQKNTWKERVAALGDVLEKAIQRKSQQF